MCRDGPTPRSLGQIRTWGVASSLDTMPIWKYAFALRGLAEEKVPPSLTGVTHGFRSSWSLAQSWNAWPMRRRLLKHMACSPRSLLLARTGRAIPVKSTSMAPTITNSSRVKARLEAEPSGFTFIGFGPVCICHYSSGAVALDRRLTKPDFVVDSRKPPGL